MSMQDYALNYIITHDARPWRIVKDGDEVGTWYTKPNESDVEVDTWHLKPNDSDVVAWLSGYYKADITGVSGSLEYLNIHMKSRV